MANLFRLLRPSRRPSAPGPEPAEGADDVATAVAADGGATDAGPEGSEAGPSEREPPELGPPEPGPRRPGPLHELDVTGLLVVDADPEEPRRDEADREAPADRSDTKVAPPEADGRLEMESLLKALAPPVTGEGAPPEPGPTPEPDAWWRIDTTGYLLPRAELPNEPLAALARSATAALGELVAAPLSVHEYAEDVFAGRVSLVVRDDSSDYAWRVDATWGDSDGRVELLEALAAMFGEPAPIVGLRRLRARGDIHGGVAQTPTLHLSAPYVGGPEPDWERVLASVVPGTRYELDEGGISYRGVRIHGMAVACAVDNDEALTRVDRWLGCLLAAAVDADSAATHVANKDLTTANPPSLDRFLPARVRAGGRAVVLGSNLIAPGDSTTPTVIIGSAQAPADATSAAENTPPSPERVAFQVPPGTAAGLVRVVVRTPLGLEASSDTLAAGDALTVVPDAVVVSAASPTSAPIGGCFTLHGSGFYNPDDVDSDGNPLAQKSAAAVTLTRQDPNDSTQTVGGPLPCPGAAGSDSQLVVKVPETLLVDSGGVAAWFNVEVARPGVPKATPAIAIHVIP